MRRHKFKFDDLLSPIAVASIVGCQPSTVRRAIERGDLPARAVYAVDGIIIAMAISCVDMEDWDQVRQRKGGRPSPDVIAGRSVTPRTQDAKTPRKTR